MIDNAATLATSVAPALPSDAGRMIARWRDLGCPCIDMDAGVVISNLERWLYHNAPHSGVWLGRVREYLYIDTYGLGSMAA